MTARSLNLAVLLSSLAITTTAPPALAKKLIAEPPTHQRLDLRVDGMACYFCAYGLERAFKKSGRISAFEMDMDAGVVSVDLAAGQALTSLDDLQKVIRQAGFTPRDDVHATLRGRIVHGEPALVLQGVDGTIPLTPSAALTAWMQSGQTDHLVDVAGPVEPAENAAFQVTPETIISVDE